MPTSIFISYSSVDASMATALKNELAPLTFDCFLAPYDLPPGQKFHDELRKEINDCAVFVALLSKHYRTSEYANQELGIAVGLEKPVLPICLDNTLPSAFIFDLHCICCKETELNEQIVNIAIAIDNIETWKGRTTDSYIEGLTHSETWAEAAHWATQLQRITKFTDNQINRIGLAVIDNNQVQNSFAARSPLKIILLEHKNKLSKELIPKLKPIFNL